LEGIHSGFLTALFEAAHKLLNADAVHCHPLGGVGLSSGLPCLCIALKLVDSRVHFGLLNLLFLIVESPQILFPGLRGDLLDVLPVPLAQRRLVGRQRERLDAIPDLHIEIGLLL
jgi:hypothetical protein